MLRRCSFKLYHQAPFSVYKIITHSKVFTSDSCLCSFPIHSSWNFKTKEISERKTLRKEVSNEAFNLNRQLVNYSSGPSLNVENPKTPDDELLEKMIAGISSDIHQKNRVYKNYLLRILKKIEELNFSTKRQGLLLLRCCTELLPDENPSVRMKLAEQIWDTIKTHTVFEIEHYNALLHCYIANNRTINVNAFIQKMNPVTPNNTTYELILRVLGEVGDINQATELISNMKSQNISATENIFNSLIICQGKIGSLKNVQEVLTMMKSLKIEKTVDTYVSLARVFAWNKNEELLIRNLENAKKCNIHFKENHIMDIVKMLATVGLYGVIPQVLKFLPDDTLMTPSISPYMQSVTTQLVFQNHPLAALEIYKCLPLPSFGPKDDTGLHGRSLVRDCVKASVPSNVIAVVTQELMSSGRNPIALQNACEAALQLGRIPLALDLFTRMKQQGLSLRPHYFWPCIIYNSKTYGEKGIMNILSTMITMDVNPDYETIINYVLPYVSFSSPQNLMRKFVENGLTVSMVLTPMMEVLLSSGQIRAASELNEIFQGKIEAEKLLKPLVKGYLTSLDQVQSIMYILEDITEKAHEKNRDWTGLFLCEFIKHNKIQQDISLFVKLVKALKNTKLKISTAATDICISHFPEKISEEILDDLRNDMIALTDERLVDDTEINNQHIPHPKDMDQDSLEAHLKELESKGMNTRGILRKLLQLYCRKGNLTAAREIMKQCEKDGVHLSAGMKAAIFDLHVKLGELDLAELTLAELNKSSPNFSLDEFKIIDFACLMVYRKKIQQAFDMINDQSKRRRIIGGRSIEMNCWRLIDAVAANGIPKETYDMFNCLVQYGYCKPTNVILGPLIRVHFRSNNLELAVDEFVRLSAKFNKTPLKHELLCKILLGMNDGRPEEIYVFNDKTNGRLSKLAQAVLNADRKVHGTGDVQLTLIAALADVGYKKTLRKLFLDPKIKFHPEALLRRCERFANEKKIAALEVIGECSRDLRHIDTQEIYEMILSVYQRDDNVKGAISLWTNMQDADINPSRKFIQNITSMLKANNRTIPPELLALVDKDEREKLLNN